MAYAVKEIFLTLQGEGAQAGRPAVFCRFAGCNLWSGREVHRPRAVCTFCDTDFVGTDGPDGGKFTTARDLASRIEATWATGGGGATERFVVCTGGEPLLQLDGSLLEALHARHFQVAVETNGTRPAPEGIDWVCVSPKAGAELLLRSGDELKFIFPQESITPDRFANLEFHHFFLQPMDGPDRESNTRAAIAYCLANPQWRLSLQTHKYLGIP
jgi:7-carboxy-7-deazaguanine synthase (Cx14CxxC type)